MSLKNSLIELMGKSNPSKTRVLIVSEYYAPHWTGVAQSIYYAGQNLLKRGHEVTVLTTHFDSKTPAQENHDGIEIIREPYQFTVSRTHYSFTIIWRFVKLLFNMKPKHVIINSPNSNILFYTLIAKLFRKHVTIYHQADILLPRQTGNVLIHWIIERIFDLMTIPSMLLADTISSFTRDYAEFSRVMRYSLYKFKPYIPDVKLSQKPPSAAFKRKMSALSRKHTLIGISGRFVEEKGFDVLFKAIPAILKAVPDAHIVFAGKKTVNYEPFYARHKALFDKHVRAKNVTFLGLLSEGDLAHFYEKLDVFVLSSRIECFALTQIEAVEKHVPIVVTDVAGARQLVKNTDAGKIVKREDPVSLADGIVEVLQKRKKYVSALQRNAKKWLQKYEEFPFV